MCSLFCIDIFLMKKAAADAATFDIQLPGQWAGYFSEDRPLGWDPVAAGNRAGDGMARFVSEEKATRWPALAVIPPNDNHIPIP